MTLLNQLLDEINAPQGYGVFLMIQMDAVPDTLQLMIATTEFDEEANGLRDKARYLVRAIGVQEHRISVGIFSGAQHKADEDHPLLYQYNSQPVGLFYRGQLQDPNALLLSLIQTYSSVFGDWRHVPDYLNTSKPLMEVFTSSGDLVGQMPEPLAKALAPVFEKQQAETKIIPGEKPKEAPPQKLLLLDDSYIVAMDFSVEKLG
jgi:hypothetical protein